MAVNSDKMQLLLPIVDIRATFHFCTSWKHMKKTIALTHPKIQLDRLVDSIKHDVKKYLKRERNKKLPADVDYWDFDCKYGITESDAKVIHLTEINKHIDQAAKSGLPSFYLEIIVKHGHRQTKDSDPWAEHR